MGVSFTVTSVVLWLAFAVRVRALLRSPGRGTPAMRAMAGALAALAATFTVLIPAVQQALNDWTSLPTSRLTGHSLVVVFGACCQAMALHWTYPVEQARRQVRRRAEAAASVVAAMWLLLWAAPASVTHIPWSVDQAAHWPILLYWLLWPSYLGLALADLLVVCCRYAAMTDRRATAVGLRTVAAGCACGLLYLASRSTYALGIWVGAADGTSMIALHVPTVVAQVCGVLITIGASLPVAVNTTTRLWRAAWRSRARRLLHPLWLDITSAVPSVLLPPVTPDAGDERSWGLYRMVIEIRDGYLQLRPYLDPAVTETALAKGHARGLAGRRLEAAVEAATIAAALAAYRAGRPVDEPSTVAAGDADLSGEVAWLTQVADAYSRSPVVRAALNATGAPLPAVQRTRTAGDRLAKLLTVVFSSATVVAALLVAIGVHAIDPNWAGALWGLGAAVFSAFLPVSAVLLGARLGWWNINEMRGRVDRAGPLAVSVPSVALGIAGLVAAHAPTEVVVMVVAIIAGIIAATIVARWWRTSINAMVVAGAAITVGAMDGVVGLVVGLVAVVVAAWSRIRTGQHTPSQVLAGAIVGVVVMSAAVPFVI